MGRRSGVRVAGVLLAAAMATGSGFALTPAAHAAEQPRTGTNVKVIVRQEPNAGNGPRTLVASLGGTVGLSLDIINGFQAELPEGAVAQVAAAPGVLDVTDDVRGRLFSNSSDDGDDNDDGDVWGGVWNSGYVGFEADKDPGSTYNVVKSINADELWKKGFAGDGVDVAVIDSGVAPVGPLVHNVVNGPDLSFDYQTGIPASVDGYGHGTHMAGLIAGSDPGVDIRALALAEDLSDLDESAKEAFVGIAPESRVVNVKVGASDGAADVSQVIAAIDWVVQNRNRNGLNIRVLNLSFGTDGTQDYVLDPLTFAVEVAWRHGIVVVVAAGNDGYDAPLANPAYDPFVIAVGASDHNKTRGDGDDTVAEFSSRGSARTPDVWAPGRSIVGLRAPGSFIDVAYPNARVDERYFLGSGTSQAAAVTSGAVALLLDRYPRLTPDQVKAVLTTSRRELKFDKTRTRDQDAGQLDLKEASKLVKALDDGKLPYHQNWTPATGLGSLDAARGTARVSDEGVAIAGEIDVQGNVWDGRTWTSAATLGRTWTGDEWLGRSWLGRSWLGRSWTGRSWTGRSWTGRTWAGRVWTGRVWTAGSWL